MHLNIRASGPEDLKHVAECAALDPHPNQMDPARWAEPQTECLTFFDEEGTIFHIRISRVMRVEIQFDERVDKKRAAEALSKGFIWLRGSAKSSGFREMVFNSKFKPLIRFCCKHFSFHQAEHELTTFL